MKVSKEGEGKGGVAEEWKLDEAATRGEKATASSKAEPTSNVATGDGKLLVVGEGRGTGEGGA